MTKEQLQEAKNRLNTLRESLAHEQHIVFVSTRTMFPKEDYSRHLNNTIRELLAIRNLLI